MRKIIVLEFISLDGVIQAPGNSNEDKSGGFEYGGWTASYGDEVFHKALEKQMQPTDLLLGRKTFEIFSGFWPEHADGWPGINAVTKHYSRMI
jgi:dihydrofolate reductase